MRVSFSTSLRNDLQDVVQNCYLRDTDGSVWGAAKVGFCLTFFVPVSFFPLLGRDAFDAGTDDKLDGAGLGLVGGILGIIPAIPVGLVVLVPALVAGVSCAIVRACKKCGQKHKSV